MASIVPSSRTLIRKVSDKMDHAGPRVIAEYGPGEGCHTREIARRMHPDSHLLLFEIDAELCDHLRRQFADDPRISVHNEDCVRLPDVLSSKGLPHCDYVVSGIPFSILEKNKKRDILDRTYAVLAPQPHSAFIIYQITNELRTRGHCDHFARAESEYCLRNVPPNFVTKFFKTTADKPLNGHHRNGHAVGSGINGNGAH
ncbi:MAG: methyltransferase domain-containing protein [Chthoniobacteraceae bacterium]